MTVKELHEMNFNDAAEQLSQEHDFVTSYETLLSYAKHLIDEENIGLALHIIKAIYEQPGDYFHYDYCMGTLQTPSPLLTSSDLEDFCEGGAFA